jgi:hypothetical protein
MSGDEKEIVVNAPSKSVTPKEKKAERTAERALEEERYNVLQISGRAGKYFGALSILIGSLLFAALSYSMLFGQTGLIFFSSNSELWVIGLWILVGLVNVVIGFLLIGSE